MSEKEEELNLENEATSTEMGNDSEENLSGDATNSKEFGEVENNDSLLLLQKDLQNEKDQNLRLYAEFENFRRRSARERIELINSAASDLMKEVLPVLDDFQRAIDYNKNADDLDAVKAGFELLYNKLFKLLSAKGLKPIESLGESFNPDKHEAIAQVPAPKENLKGCIIDVVEQGYALHEKILRHPKVVVGT